MPANPEKRSDRPNPLPSQAVDPFTDVFTAMRVRSAMYCRMEATAPWGLAFAATPHAKFGLVTRGSCWLKVDGEKAAIPLRGGDCYVVAAHVGISVRDALRSRVVDGEALAHSAKEGALLRFGGGGAPSTIVSGLFELDTDAWAHAAGGPRRQGVARLGPLFGLLPNVVCVRGDEAPTAPLGATLDLLAAETAGAALGSSLVIHRLAEILFVQVIRAHLAGRGAAGPGWLAALGDANLGPALRAMHQEPAGRWSVASLAARAGMSRSAFALHFKARVGEAPLEYLTRWRMYQATRQLQAGERGIAEIARAVGYESAGAFNRAFQRVYRRTPGSFRKE